MGCVQSVPRSVHTSTNQGVSVFYLKHIFLEELKSAGFDQTSTIYELEDATSPSHGFIRQKGAEVKDPIDGRPGCAYVDCLMGEDHVGPANTMLSYCCSYTIGDIIDTLDDFCKVKKQDPKRTYIWICCLCINQHRVAEKNKGKKRKKYQGEENDIYEFKDALQNRMRGCQVVAMMFPWNKSLYLSKVWCLYEIFTAQKLGRPIFITMPPDEKRKMATALADDADLYDVLLKTIGQTKIQNASASQNVDKSNILKLVEKGPGLSSLNDEVNNLLKESIEDLIMSSVDTIEQETENPSSNKELALLVGRLGALLDSTGSYDLSFQLHYKALSIFLKVYGDTNHHVAAAHHNLGRALFKVGDLDGALEHYQKVLAIDEKIAGEDHEDTVKSISNVADILRAQKKYDEAEKQIKRVLEIRHKILGYHQDTARSHSQLGLLYHTKEEFDDAIVEHKKALEIALGLLGENHLETATIYHNTGCALVEKEQHDQALINFQKALVIYQDLLGEDNPKTENTEAWVEACKEAMEDSY